MRRLAMSQISVLSVLLLSGCARDTAHVIPYAQNQFQLIAYDSEESEALGKAIHQAKKTCGKSGMDYSMINQNVVYQGAVSPEANKLSKNLASYIGSLTGAVIPSTATDEDYKVTLLIQCIPKTKA